MSHQKLPEYIRKNRQNYYYPFVIRAKYQKQF
jgi:hypothetical protein